MATEDGGAPVQEPCLYEVELSRVQVNTNLFTSLVDISNNLLDDYHLKTLSVNPRNLLYVLTDPVESWSELSSPNIYCAIEVYLEGKIPNIPVSETLTKTIRYALAAVPALASTPLVIAHIVNLFKREDRSEDYGLKAINILTSFYNREEATAKSTTPEVPLTNLQRKWPRLYYIGVYSDLTTDSLSLWEKYNFSVLFAGQMEDPEWLLQDVFNLTPACVMITTLRDYQLETAEDKFLSLVSIAEDCQSMFITHLSLWRVLDPQVSLRILGNYRKTIPKLVLDLHYPWQESDQTGVEDFLRQPNKVELKLHLVKKLAQKYFRGSLPFQLSQDTEVVFLLVGLQHHTIEEAQANLQIERDTVIESLRQSFEMARDYYNILLPGVSEPSPKR
ncbi:RNA cytidine acetyltransferase [Quillaja saponaria]|uniref:RNA cytidine acetyltransferase n=1 Tax=Quillaja saponaria TaxID=32244 RepID=A0AAD7PA21_QUISA|nr:RNA cytidine acetyltransferase [Quillaja saponaria]